MSDRISLYKVNSPERLFSCPIYFPHHVPFITSATLHLGSMLPMCLGCAGLTSTFPPNNKAANNKSKVTQMISVKRPRTAYFIGREMIMTEQKQRTRIYYFIKRMILSCIEDSFLFLNETICTLFYISDWHPVAYFIAPRLPSLTWKN